MPCSMHDWRVTRVFVSIVLPWKASVTLITMMPSLELTKSHWIRALCPEYFTTVSPMNDNQHNMNLICLYLELYLNSTLSCSVASHLMISISRLLCDFYKYYIALLWAIGKDQYDFLGDTFFAIFEWIYMKFWNGIVSRPKLAQMSGKPLLLLNPIFAFLMLPDMW